MSSRKLWSILNLGLKHANKSSNIKILRSEFKRNFYRTGIVNGTFPKLDVEHTGITKIVDTSHRSLSVGFQDDLAADFQYIWLRDNCRCVKCRHPTTKQKLLDTVSLDINIKPISHEVTSTGQLKIVWPESDGRYHTSFYEPEWLHKYGTGFRLEHSIHDQLPPMVPWNAEIIENVKPEISYEEVMSTDRGVKAWLEMLYKYGIAIMRGVPCKKDEVVNVVERFAYIKKTKWGTSFDVLCEPDPGHLALTGMYLEHHTDMNYLEKSPGLQALHCLKANSDTENDIGGQSFFVDGFYISKWLQKEHPASFHALTSTLVKFKIYSHNMEYCNTHNIICASKTGNIQEVHYNTRTMAPLEGPPDAVQPFYEAYKLFGQKMREPESEFAFNLVPGDLVAFNNRRILHGRTQFDPSRISRHLQGCYGDIDEVITRYKSNVSPPE